MAATLALDVYGTLIDPLGIARDLEKLIGSAAGEFAGAWREKQLEYLFRRGLGNDYVPFSVCTGQALDYTCGVLGVDISPGDRRLLMERYVDLPAYRGTSAALEALAGSGCRCFAFSNGEPDDLRKLLDKSGLAPFLAGVVSVHRIRSFKPDPAVYEHFLEIAGSCAEDTWLISGNPFDVIGAHNAGWNTAWVKRDPGAVFDPWGIEPTVVVRSLDELLEPLSG
jgi:2-haloacid dehalogenase